MISWIVATHDYTILDANLGATLRPLDPGDEVVDVWYAPSITAAYAQGQARATRPIRCYIHHDVEILDLPRLRRELLSACRNDVGMVGVIGSRTATLPWWHGELCGSIVDRRFGPLKGGPGGQAAILDGLLLATAQTVDWDEAFAGWHGYDHDACWQMLGRGLTNWCLDDGAELVRHNTTGPHALANLNGWDEAAALLQKKWGTDG